MKNCLKNCLRWIVSFGMAVALASCGTQHVAVTRQPDGEMTSLNNRHANKVSSERESATAEKKSNRETKANTLAEKYAAMMKVDAGSLENAALLEFMDDWYGVPYKYSGTDKKGIDCSGFVCMLYNTVYQRGLSGTSGALYKASRRVKRGDLEQGDLVFFKISRGRVSHVGVYVANGYFVHASTKAGVVLSNLNEPYYKKYYGGAGRLKD